MPENAHIDIQEKVREYLAVGVQLVLVVDPGTRTIAAERPVGQAVRYVEGDDVACEDVFPGLLLPVSAAFEG